MSDLKWQVRALRELLAEAERRLNEQDESVQIGGPCVATTRSGHSVFVHRFAPGVDGDTHYYWNDGIIFPVWKNGRYRENEERDEDIVSIQRDLTDDEILRFQCFGVLPKA